MPNVTTEEIIGWQKRRNRQETVESISQTTPWSTSTISQYTTGLESTAKFAPPNIIVSWQGDGTNFVPSITIAEGPAVKVDSFIEDNSFIEDEDAPITYRPKTFSPSAADTFRNCPLRWKLRYADHLTEGPPGEPAIVGTFVHTVLENLLKLDPKERTLTAARSICTSNWPDMVSSHAFNSLDYDEDGRNKFKNKAWAFVEGYFDMIKPEKAKVIECEKKVTVKLNDVPFNGIIDLVEQGKDGLIVTDYKTGKAPSSARLEDALSQTWLYAAALEKKGEPVESVRLVYIGNGGNRPGLIFSRDMDQKAKNKAVKRHKRTWDNVHKALESKDFKAKPGPLCGWCGFRDRCPEGAAEYKKRERAKLQFPVF